ncbi:glyoxalase [Jeongeupia sp. HS-3]|uniref:VOC family protein n=1 Tax=Jeongeupia sp. HS-3 TaxID=1009682 RepID=UPI0018A44FB4|nr:VOC family protein [Jeongeupia sp. HS-3]BCL75094.1 glyoxalase [Jeongeupia sp. HS-3]
MIFELPGIILFTENYAECVAFYRDALGLPDVFSKPGLTALNFGGAYLMIETGGVGGAGQKSVGENPTILRFNVRDVGEAASTLRRQGVAVEINHFDWGVVGCFCDPDGNRCELKDHSANFHALTR